MKRRILTLMMTLIFLLSMIPAQAFAAEMTSEIAIAPQYEDAKSFSNGYAAVKKNGKWGYIDETGKVIVDFQYDWAGPFSEGVAIVMTLEDLVYRYGGGDSYTETAYVAHLIDAKGMDVVLTDSSFEDSTFPDGYSAAPVTEWYDELSGGMTPDVLTELETSWFCNGGVVYAGGPVYRKDGSQILLKSYDDLFIPDSWTWDYPYFDYYCATGPCVDGIIPMYAGLMGSADGYGQCFYMDTQGNVLRTFTPANWDIGEGICEVFAPDDGRILALQIQEPVEDQWGFYYTRYGVMDLGGKWIVEPEYINYYIYLGGDFYTDYGTLTLADKDGNWGAVGLNGETLVDFDYTWMSVFSEGYAAARQADGTCVYLDTQGNTYQIGGIDGGIASVSACGAFNSDGVAAVYDTATGKAYCIINQPVNGVFPAIKGSDLMDPSVYFPGYDGTGTPSATPSVEELVAIEENGLYGYLRLNLKALVNPFNDVPVGSFYYESVLWALEKGITSGTSGTSFSPNNDCLRAQVVTFLWRAAGEPTPRKTKNPFVDVNPTDFYYKAVLWAVDKGITNGTDATHFSPMGVCNRAQVVTFLHRAFGSPAAGNATSSFNDVPANSWYATPILWAVREGITNGLSSTAFGPNANCNRAQIVTFLYRAYN